MRSSPLTGWGMGSPTSLLIPEKYLSNYTCRLYLLSFDISTWMISISLRTTGADVLFFAPCRHFLKDIGVLDCSYSTPSYRLDRKISRCTTTFCFGSGSSVPVYLGRFCPRV